MREAAAESDSAGADPLIVETLSACATMEEWLAALREHPAAMGLNERAEVGEVDVRSACYGHESTPVCEDAESAGVLR